MQAMTATAASFYSHLSQRIGLLSLPPIALPFPCSAPSLSPVSPLLMLLTMGHLTACSKSQRMYLRGKSSVAAMSCSHPTRARAWELPDKS
jgi:hypothetical protein